MSFNLLHHIIIIKLEHYCYFALVQKENRNNIICDIIRRENFYNGWFDTFKYTGALSDEIISSLINNELNSSKNTFHYRTKHDVRKFNGLQISKKKLGIHNKFNSQISQVLIS